MSNHSYFIFVPFLLFLKSVMQWCQQNRKEAIKKGVRVWFGCQRKKFSRNVSRLKFRKVETPLLRINHSKIQNWFHNKKKSSNEIKDILQLAIVSMDNYKNLVSRSRWGQKIMWCLRNSLCMSSLWWYKCYRLHGLWWIYQHWYDLKVTLKTMNLSTFLNICFDFYCNSYSHDFSWSTF